MNMALKIITLQRTRCENLCENEASINGSGYGRYNAKCRYCQKAFNAYPSIIFCFCCGMRLSRRRSVTKNLKYKEPLIMRIG